MEKYSLEELKLLVEWIKQQEIRADEKYWKELGLSDCPTSEDLHLEEKIVLLIVRGNSYDLY